MSTPTNGSAVKLIMFFFIIVIFWKHLWSYLLSQTKFIWSNDLHLFLIMSITSWPMIYIFTYHEMTLKGGLIRRNIGFPDDEDLFSNFCYELHINKWKWCVSCLGRGKGEYFEIPNIYLFFLLDTVYAWTLTGVPVLIFSILIFSTKCFFFLLFSTYDSIFFVCNYHLYFHYPHPFLLMLCS